MITIGNSMMVTISDGTNDGTKRVRQTSDIRKRLESVYGFGKLFICFYDFIFIRYLGYFFK
jgi:hypothetical protein